MYRLFKSNQPFVALVVALLGFLILLPVFIFESPEIKLNTGFEDAEAFLRQKWVLLPVTLTFILATAMMLNRLFIKTALIPIKNYLPAFTYTLLACLSFAWTDLTWPFIANMFLVLSLLHFFSTYDEISVLDSHFRAGFWLGMAALTVPVFSFYLLAYFMITLRNRAFLITEFISLFLGFIAPWFYLFIFNYFYQDQVVFPLIVSLNWTPIQAYLVERTFSEFTFHYMILLSLFTGAYFYSQSFSSNTKKTLVSKSSMTNLALFAILFLFLSLGRNENYGFITVALPASTIIVFNFIEDKKRRFPFYLFHILFWVSLGVYALRLVLDI